MLNQDFDFLTVTPEVRELYSIPTEQRIIESYKLKLNSECISFSQKFFNSNYISPIASVVSAGICTISYIYLRQPAGDVARQIKFERMNPAKRMVLRGVPALSLFATVYFARQCKSY
ncbi:unnamed protein product (macronuclear) [Paramecium tetraurelia]|uniref:HIG1 domain-containing protein n=1 Tax=Paramecium tetraurelia TaxID=5888 RepID=A0BPZ5_PARTE|nr:uncharacterized protein GSPATT00005363001 [Paramecium tetraurelia]CAK60612.1 unnamed protein product [Paramecium tetraurelia]|eukprot:XP_001428010.1 hypothetical protein (macronuclear) [Paramecium tetraurelia strain d4-2]